MPTYALGDAPSDYKGDAPKAFALIPDDTILEAVITEINEDVKPFFEKDAKGNFLLDANGEKIPVVKLAWTFATNYDGQDRNVWGETGVSFVEHPDCKFYAWTQEALGVDLVKGFVVDTDHLIGQPVRVVMGQRSYTKKGETEKKTVNFVKDVMRAKSAMRSAPATTPVEDPF